MSKHIDVHQENRIADILDDLTRALTEVHETDRALDYAIRNRDAFIRRAREAGATVATLVRVTGLSRSQVDNILGNRRA